LSALLLWGKEYNKVGKKAKEKRKKGKKENIEYRTPNVEL